MQDPTYGAYFDQKTEIQLQTLYGVVALGADTTTYHYNEMAASQMEQLVSDEHSRMIMTTSYPLESEETCSFIRDLSALCDETLTGDF